jgi:hypothetical protein
MVVAGKGTVHKLSRLAMGTEGRGGRGVGLQTRGSLLDILLRGCIASDGESFGSPANAFL